MDHTQTTAERDARLEAGRKAEQAHTLHKQSIRDALEVAARAYEGMAQGLAFSPALAEEHRAKAARWRELATRLDVVSLLKAEG